MTILKELTVATGKYTDQSGTEKTRWKTIGHLHDGKNGQYITLDPMMNLAAIPKKENDDRVYVNMFDPKPKDGQGRTQQAGTASKPRPQTGSGFDGPDDDIGF